VCNPKGEERRSQQRSTVFLSNFYNVVNDISHDFYILIIYIEILLDCDWLV
jgi:hypothetical protein